MRLGLIAFTALYPALIASPEIPPFAFTSLSTSCAASRITFQRFSGEQRISLSVGTGAVLCAGSPFDQGCYPRRTGLRRRTAGARAEVGDDPRQGRKQGGPFCHASAVEERRG